MLLLLDFDGTLVAFKQRPEDVRLDERTRTLLKRLARQPRVRLGFISGRRRQELERLIGVGGARYWGVHGWESGERKRLSDSSRRTLERVKKRLEQRIGRLGGISLEDKGAGLALNYRGASRGAALRARAALREAMTEVNSSFRVLRGHQILEVLPPEVQGKGAVARKLANESPEGTLIIYAGDDTTDEAAFAALSHGVTIRVGRGQGTRARFRLRDPREVSEFLERLEAECAAGG